MDFNCFSNVIEKFKGAGYLWCLLRRNSGRQIFSLLGLANLMQVKETTIKRYLQNKELFRSYKKLDADTFEVYLTSIKKLPYGAGVKFEMVSASLASILNWSRLATTIHLQRCARKSSIQKQKQQKKKILRKRFINHTDLFDDILPATNDCGVNRIIFKSTKSVFIGTESNYSGVSLKTLSKVTGKSEATIRKSLKYAPKLRVFKETSKETYNEAYFFDAETFANSSKRFYQFRGTFFEPLPNAYDPIIPILSVHGFSEYKNRYMRLRDYKKTSTQFT
jgi:hypothetical protein